MDPKLLELVRDLTARGFNQDDIKASLKVRGYSDQMIDQAFSSIASEKTYATPLPPAPAAPLTPSHFPTYIPARPQPAPTPTRTPEAPSISFSPYSEETPEPNLPPGIALHDEQEITEIPLAKNPEPSPVRPPTLMEHMVSPVVQSPAPQPPILQTPPVTPPPTPLRPPVLPPTQPFQPIPPLPEYLPNGRALLKEAWTLYKNRFFTLIGVLLYQLLIMAPVAAVVVGAWYFLTPLFAQNLALLIAFGGLVVLFMFFLIVLRGWQDVALITAIVHSDKNISVRESYRMSWRKIFSYWWLMFLGALLTAGGFTFFIVPGILFAIWFSFGAFILIAEDLRGTNALMQSKEYVRGYWWAIIWRFIFLGLFSLGISLAIGTPLLIATYLFNLPDVIQRIILALVGILLTPFLSVYDFILYKHLSIIKGTNPVASSGKKWIIIVIAFLGLIGFAAVNYFVIPQFGPTVSIPVLQNTNTSITADEGARQQSQSINQNSNIRQVQFALELYHDKYNAYPKDLAEAEPMLGASMGATLGSYIYYSTGPNVYSLCVDPNTTQEKCVDQNSK